MNRIFFIIVLTLISLSGCLEKEKFSDFDCEELAMKDFRGLPSYGQTYKENCLNREIKYSRKLCQEAFNDLLFGKKIEEIKKTYGDRIVSCFNERELLKYAPGHLNNNTK